MVKPIAAAGLLAMAVSAQDIQSYCFKPVRVRVLVLSGRNGHDWRTGSPFLKKVLEDTGRFALRLEEEPNGIDAETLAPFDVLVVDYCGPRWPTVAERAVEAFVRSGKDLVVVHAASYPFGDQIVLDGGQRTTDTVEPAWPEWRKMAGVYWDMRNEHRTGRGNRHTFKLKFDDRDHPGLKDFDEIYYATDEYCTKFHCEPGVKVNVLATAYDDPRYRGTGRDEPVLMTEQYGQGRVFHTILGHDLTALVKPDSVVTFVRGTEWAATGAVTLPTPAQARAAAPKPLGVLVITGGHGYNLSFDSAFDGYDDLAWNHATSNEEAFRRDIRNRYDALVYCDSMDVSGTGRKNLRDFVGAGKGLLWTRGREPGAPKIEPAKPK